MAERIRNRIKKNKKTEFFYKKYAFEILVLGLFILGFFLLWEKLNIKTIAWGIITTTTRTIVNLIRDVSVRLGNIISRVETSDLVGIALILTALILVLNRTRHRVIGSHPNLASCPQCEGALRRTHGKTKHKYLELLLFCKVKRYACRKCSFEGIAMITGDDKGRGK